MFWAVLVRGWLWLWLRLKIEILGVLVFFDLSSPDLNSEMQFETVLSSFGAKLDADLTLVKNLSIDVSFFLNFIPLLKGIKQDPLYFSGFSLFLIIMTLLVK